METLSRLWWSLYTWILDFGIFEKECHSCNKKVSHIYWMAGNKPICDFCVYELEMDEQRRVNEATPEEIQAYFDEQAACLRDEMDAQDMQFEPVGIRLEGFGEREEGLDLDWYDGPEVDEDDEEEYYTPPVTVKPTWKDKNCAKCGKQFRTSNDSEMCYVATYSASAAAWRQRRVISTPHLFWPAI